jgi:hypothetical protein
MKKTTLTKKQTQNLLRKAYGFVDKYGKLFVTDDILIKSNEFQLLEGAKDYIIVFSYDNVTIDRGTVIFETHDGDTERFTVLTVANNITSLIN